MEEIKVSEMLQADSINKDDSVMIIQSGVNKKASGSETTATGTSLSLTSVADTCKVKSNSKNLFNSDNPKSIYINGSTTYTTISNGIKVTKTATGVGFILFEIKDITNDVGKTFTLKTNFTSTGHYIIGLADASGGNRISGASTTTSGEAISYTIPEITTSSKLVIWLYGPDGATGDIDYTNIQVEEGSTATEYNPYNTSVKICGRNLIDESQYLVGYLIDANGVPQANPVWSTSDNIYLTAEATISAKRISGATNNSQLNITQFNSAGTLLKRDTYSFTNDTYSLTFTPETNVTYVRIGYRHETTEDVQLELGSTATTYQKFEGQYLNLVTGEEKIAFTYNEKTSISSNGSVIITYNTKGRLLNNDDTLVIKEYADREIVYDVGALSGSGTTSLTFPDISKYSFVEIFFANASGFHGGSVTLIPKFAIGVDFTITSNTMSASNDVIYLNMNRYTLSSTSITWRRRTEKTISGTTISSSTSTTETNLVIERIIGYK